jgi:inner membrane protein
MPSIMSHAAVPLALGIGLRKTRVPLPLLLAGIAGSMLPDADVILFRFGATYGDSWSHRGFSHSLLFASVVGLLALVALRRLRVPRLHIFLFVAASTASHGLLDMFTDGGHGVAYLWPFSDQRFFVPFRPIHVSPINVSRFMARAMRVLTSELLWIWLPAIVVAGMLRLFLPSAARPSSSRRKYVS